MQYQIFCDGVPVATTDKTHHTLKGLEAQHSYLLRVETLKAAAKERSAVAAARWVWR